MLLNSDKTKYMVINFCKSLEFQSRLHVEGKMLQQVKETRLLGVILRDDLSFKSNTNHLCKKAYQRMIILRKLIKFNVSTEDLIHIYILFIRSAVAQSAVVWDSSITADEISQLERIQKSALRIIYSNNYKCYENALKMASLPTLSERRRKLTLKFAIKCTQNEKTSDMFPLNPSDINTRHSEKYLVPKACTNRLAHSAIPQMARQLNEHVKCS